MGEGATPEKEPRAWSGRQRNTKQHSTRLHKPVLAQSHTALPHFGDRTIPTCRVRCRQSSCIRTPQPGGRRRCHGHGSSRPNADSISWLFVREPKTDVRVRSAGTAQMRMDNRLIREVLSWMAAASPITLCARKLVQYATYEGGDVADLRTLSKSWTLASHDRAVNGKAYRA